MFFPSYKLFLLLIGVCSFSVFAWTDTQTGWRRHCLKQYLLSHSIAGIQLTNRFQTFSWCSSSVCVMLNKSNIWFVSLVVCEGWWKKLTSWLINACFSMCCWRQGAPRFSPRMIDFSLSFAVQVLTDVMKSWLMSCTDDSLHVDGFLQCNLDDVLCWLLMNPHVCTVPVGKV